MNGRLTLLLVLFAINSFAQVSIGAQVYVEPGQTRAQIERWFSLLQEHGMTVCRIRMDESHMVTSDVYDFSLYDIAFEEAQNHGVKVFATIFPAEENAKGVGGFKFPNTATHHKQVASFINALVEHFKEHPALQAWVLQNEPGAGKIPSTPFSQDKFAAWKRDHVAAASYNGYIKKHQEEANFLFDYTTWYLDWIATEVRKYDRTTALHVNNHMIFELLPEYDFQGWQSFLDHLGASMHPSWHFGYFDRDQYPLAISVNCNLIKNGAGDLPFWVTELQGGNNNFSGYNPLMPTAAEIQQWLLTSIFSGTEGIIFWTLNARSVGFEAGEWAMVDYQNNPTPRLTAAGKITELLKDYPDLATAKPITSDIHLLYSRPSMTYQKNAEITSSTVQHYFDARKQGGHIKSVLGYYKALLQQGVTPEINSLQSFDWQNSNATVILPNMVIIPRAYYAKMKDFVKRGGILIMTGQSGHLDEYQFNVFQEGWELAALFGAEMKEFEAVADSFSLQIEEQVLASHFLRGKLYARNASVIAKSEEEVVGVENRFGGGRAIWIPTMIGLGSWKWQSSELGEYIVNIVGKDVQKGLPDNLIMQKMRSDQFDYTLIINTSGESQSIEQSLSGLEKPVLIFNHRLDTEESILSDSGIAVIKSSR